MILDLPKANGKLAFFDFDRTLVAHQYSKGYVKDRQASYKMECLYMLTAMEEEHKDDRPLPCMQWYTRKLFDEGYGLYCLTHEVFNLRDSLKQSQLKAFYPDTPMTYLTVDIPGHKTDMMAAVAAAEGCMHSDIIFVDDRMDTIQQALAEGFDAKHLSDIVVMYEDAQIPQQQGSSIKPKGFAEILAEDPQLMEKVTYEEAMRVNTGLSDESIEDVYRQCRLLTEMNGRGLSG